MFVNTFFCLLLCVCVCLFFSGTVKFLEVIKPFCAVLPEIQKPERKVSVTFCSYFY